MFTLKNRNSRSSNTTTESPASASVSVPPFRLHFYHELDDWQKDNHYIKSGYVRETLSYRKCLESLFYLHNETVNIYSHLVPSSLVFASIYWYINYRLPIYDNYLGSWEKLNFLQFGVACTLCLFMSSTFHCMKSHSHRFSRIGNQFDYFGIVILTTCSLISIILFAFYDEPLYKRSFVLMFLGFGTACTVLTLHPRFSTPLYRPYRSLMFVLFGLSGVAPVIAASQLYGFELASKRASINWLALEGLFYIGGAVLYAARIPERFSHHEQDENSLLRKPLPGRWDIFGASHQIFHFMVVIAAYCHWRALVGCYHYLHLVTLSN